MGQCDGWEDAAIKTYVPVKLKQEHVSRNIQQFTAFFLFFFFFVSICARSKCGAAMSGLPSPQLALEISEASCSNFKSQAQEVTLKLIMANV